MSDGAGGRSGRREVGVPLRGAARVVFTTTFVACGAFLALTRLAPSLGEEEAWRRLPRTVDSLSGYLGRCGDCRHRTAVRRALDATQRAYGLVARLDLHGPRSGQSRIGEQAWQGDLGADGTTVVTAGSDGIVSWNASTGARKETRRMAEYTPSLGVRDSLGYAVDAVAVPADGRRIASISDEGVVWLWDAETGDSVATFTTGDEDVTGFTASSDGRRVLWVNAVVRAGTWEVGAADAVRFPHDGVTAAALTDDGVVTASRGRVVHWSRDGRVIRDTSAPPYADPIAVSGDGRVVVAVEGAVVRLASAESGAEVARLEGLDDTPVSACLSDSAGTVVLGTEQGALVLWRAGSSRPMARVRAHPYAVDALDCTGDGRRALSIGAGSTEAKVWDLAVLASGGIERESATVAVSNDDERTLMDWAADRGLLERWPLMSRFADGASDRATAFALAGLALSLLAMVASSGLIVGRRRR